MHGLHQRGAAGHVLDKTPRACGSPWTRPASVEVLLHIVAHLGASGRTRRHGGDDAAADVLCQTVDLIDELGDIVLAHVGQQRVYEVRAGGRTFALAGTGQEQAYSVSSLWIISLSFSLIWPALP